MHFHHRDPNQKKFGIGKSAYSYAWETIIEEAKKCDLICSNCHAETHDAGYTNSQGK